MEGGPPCPPALSKAWGTPRSLDRYASLECDILQDPPTCEGVGGHRGPPSSGFLVKIKALSPEKQREVENFVTSLDLSVSTLIYVSASETNAAGSRIFKEDAELFKRLAQ